MLILMVNLNRKINNMAKIEKSEAEWKEQLTPQQYLITRRHGTEPAFSGPHQDEHRDGTFKCICCGKELFQTNSKFDSGTGWPSFYEPKDSDSVSEHKDRSFFMTRTEVRCSDCEAHLGHVFPDGPAPTGLRYCMNGHAMSFDPDE